MVAPDRMISLAVLALAAMAGSISAQAVPSIRSDDTGIVVSIPQNQKLYVETLRNNGNIVGTQQEVVLKSDFDALSSQVDAMSSAISAQVADQIDQALAGAVNDAVLQAGQRTATAEDRIASLETATTSLAQTTRAVSLLSQDVAYLIAHTANASACAATGQIHSGNGECFDPVPQCPRPENVTGGTVSLSADFIIPGVTATYTCSGTDSFVAGPTLRTCRESTQQFDGRQPRCLTCAVTNCLQCVNNTRTCARCTYGHDLSADSSSCVLRNIDVLMFGGQVGGTGHNHRVVQRLPANSQQWVRYQPDPPISLSQGAAALIRGSLYVVGAGGHAGSSGGYMRRSGSNVWSTLPMLNGFNSPSPFYATVNEKFYLFGRQGAAVYAPLSNTDSWTSLPLANTLAGRNFGGTAVIGNLIYCIGGYNPSTREYSDNVDIFNTTSGTWTAGTVMTEARSRFAAAAFDGKIYVMGGRSPNNLIIDTVQEFDPATNNWRTRAAMPEAWEAMSTGPMPTYGNGEIMIPFGYKRANTGLQNSLTYSVRQNTWTTGPAPNTRLGIYTVVQGALQ